MADPSTRARAYGTMAALFTAATAYQAVGFVRAMARHELRAGLLFTMLLTGLAAAGLWMRETWGRSLALIVAVANAGLGALLVLSAIASHDGLIVPVAFLALNVIVATVLSRSWFDAAEEPP